MKKRFIFVTVFVLISTILFAQKKDLKKIELAGGLATIELPNSFNLPMELPAISFDSTPVYKSWILRNEKNPFISLIYDYPPDSEYIKVTDNDITVWADKQLGALKKSKNFNYIDDGIYLQNWKNISYIKWYTKRENSLDTYNMLFFTNINDKLIQFNFSCPAKLRKKWEPIADSIANSLRVIESTSVNND